MPPGFHTLLPCARGTYDCLVQPERLKVHSARTDRSFDRAAARGRGSRLIRALYQFCKLTAKRAKETQALWRLSNVSPAGSIFVFIRHLLTSFIVLYCGGHRRRLCGTQCRGVKARSQDTQTIACGYEKSRHQSWPTSQQTWGENVSSLWR